MIFGRRNMKSGWRLRCLESRETGTALSNSLTILTQNQWSFNMINYNDIVQPF